MSIETLTASTGSAKHIYVFGPITSDFVANISMIDATNDSAVATIPLDFSLISDGRSVIDGVRLEAKIELRGGFRYEFHAEAKGPNLSGTTNPVQVSLGIGGNAGVTSVSAHFDRDRNHDAGDHWSEWTIR